MRRARCVHSSRVREAAFFFYGTLMQREVLSKVLGRRVWPRMLTPARLAGYRRVAVRGASYPVVLPQRGASVMGLILQSVTRAERARLCAYEGDGYELASAVAELPAKRRRLVFLFRPKLGALTVTRKPWSLSRWRLHQNFIPDERLGR